MKVKRLYNYNIPMKSHNSAILKLITERKIVTSSEVAKSLDVSWNTADSYLKDLVIDGKIVRIKKAGVTLWVKK